MDRNKQNLGAATQLFAARPLGQVVSQNALEETPMVVSLKTGSRASTPVALRKGAFNHRDNGIIRGRAYEGNAETQRLLRMLEDLEEVEKEYKFGYG